jgi:CRP-like cAMP-binding protein
MDGPDHHKLDVPLLKEEESDLETMGSDIRFPAGSILMGQNEHTDFALLIRKGYAKVVAAEPRRIVGIRGPGELVGEMAAIRRAPRSASMFAINDIVALHIPGNRWIEFLIGHPRAAVAQLRLSQERLAESTRKNVESLLGVEQKLAKAIVELWSKGLGNGPKESPVLRFSQQDLADIAGISLDSVKQIIRSLKARKVVTTSRQSTTIVDLDTLREISRGESTGIA